MRVVICDTPTRTRRPGWSPGSPQALRARPEAVLGLATGGTMEQVYEGLIAAHRAGLELARAATFNLDEYVGLAPDHPQSYRGYMRAASVRPRRPRYPTATFVPSGDGDPARAARRLRGGAAAPRTDRPATAGPRPQRPYRLQRARIVARLADPREDADPHHARGQCALLRRGRDAAALGGDDGHRHHPRGARDPRPGARARARPPRSGTRSRGR